MKIKIKQDTFDSLIEAIEQDTFICEMCKSITFPKVEISDRATITVTSTMQQIPGAQNSPRSYRHVCKECADEFHAEEDLKSSNSSYSTTTVFIDTIILDHGIQLTVLGEKCGKVIADNVEDACYKLLKHLLKGGRAYVVEMSDCGTEVIKILSKHLKVIPVHLTADDMFDETFDIGVDHNDIIRWRDENVKENL